MISTIYKLSSTAPAQDISLKPEAWRILTQINGERTVTDIAQGLGMDENLVKQVAVTLYQAGILEMTAPEPNVPAQPAIVPTAFLDLMQHELARAMGPMAEMIIEDEIQGLGQTRALFRQELIPDLVERVSESIRDETRRIKFQQVMLEAIRKL